MNTNLHSDKKNYLLLLVICLLAYWPLSFSVFSLKNDALIYFLPYRYHISEAIQNGEFPWWNPYLYTGLPLHSDIQSGTWNPVVLLLSCFTRYNMTVLQWELLFYLFIGAAGFYKLAKQAGGSPQVSLLAAIIYMCCGFMTDSVSIVPWITSAAYLPFVFCYAWQLLKTPATGTAFKLACALVLLLTAGYPSFFAFACYILLAGFIAFYIKHRKNSQHLKVVLQKGLLSVNFAVMVASPVLLSWFDFFGYYDRGSGLTLTQASGNSFPPFSTVSYLFPSAVYKEHPWLATDVSVRNASIGIFFLLFFIAALFQRKTAVQKFILAGTMICFLFSLGDYLPVQGFFYRFLPLMDTFRHPASMRLFTSIGMILIALPFLEGFLQQLPDYIKRCKQVSIGLIVILLLVIGYYFFSSPSFTAGFNKAWKDKVTFSNLIVIQGIIQVAFLLIFLGLSKNYRRFLPAVIAANAVLLCWVASPFTLISQTKTSAVNSRLAEFPKGFPLPGLQSPVNAAAQISFTHSPLVYDDFYTKKITIQDNVITPTLNKNYQSFLVDSNLRAKLNDYPFIYFSDSSVNSLDAAPDSGRIVLLDSLTRYRPLEHTKGSIVIKQFSSNSITLDISAEGYGLLNFFQQYHHGWRAWVDKEEVPVYKTNKAFLSIPVSKGTHEVRLRFYPDPFVKYCIWLSVLAMLVITVFFVSQMIKRKK